MIAQFAELSPEIQNKLANIQLLCVDVDGVLTKGEITYDSNGNELKSFHALDGHGLKMLIASGIEVAWISARKSLPSEIRAKELGVQHIYLGPIPKGETVQKLQKQLGVLPEQTAFIGDDVFDVHAMQHCGVRVAVANAHEFVKAHTDIVLAKQGGAGAVRLFCDFLLESQNHLDGFYSKYLQG